MKHSFDQKIREAIHSEEITVPAHIHMQTEQLLAALPEKHSKSKILIFPTTLRRVSAVAACFLFVMLVLLPNVSVAYAQSLEDVPVIGKLVQVLTIRNYFYSDEHRELEAEIPSVNDPDHIYASELINKDVDELARATIQKFYDELELSGDKGYGSIHIDYEVVTNTSEWFTLKLAVSEIEASSGNSLHFYHIDRVNGQYVTFADLFNSKDYVVLEQLILAQMKAEMSADADVHYWTEETMSGQAFTTLDDTQNFYFNETGGLVIVYEQFEVAPGSMGCPEFLLSPSEYMPYIVPRYAEILNID